MKTLKIMGFLALVSFASVAYAQKGTHVFPKPAPTNEPPPPVLIAEPPPERLPVPEPKPTLQMPPPPQIYVFAQKPLAGRPIILTSERAQTIIDQFKGTYAKLENPRFLIYVTRNLAAPVAGGADDPQALPEVQRLFALPLQAAGASITDPQATALLLAGKPIEAIIGAANTPQAVKGREILAKVADVVIEVMITSKTIAVEGVEGQGTTIPDIQSKAVRLSDSKILGQASSTLMTNRIPPATLANYDVRELAECAALALMEQM